MSGFPNQSISPGTYRAVCREETFLKAVANGHSAVFPSCFCEVEGAVVDFFKDGQWVWSCNATYAAANFVLQPFNDKEKSVTSIGAPTALGAWQPNADRLVPRGEVVWASGPLGFAGSVAGKPVASVRKSGRQWLARIEGWQWHVTPDMGVARMNQIPGDKIKMTPVKAFGTAKGARDEVQGILAEAGKEP